ncbi:hypothetical protein Q7P37_002295 [Cladosporium fusiforme]
MVFHLPADGDNTAEPDGLSFNQPRATPQGLEPISSSSVNKLPDPQKRAALSELATIPETTDSRAWDHQIEAGPASKELQLKDVRNDAIESFKQQKKAEILALSEAISQTERSILQASGGNIGEAELRKLVEEKHAKELSEGLTSWLPGVQLQLNSDLAKTVDESETIGMLGNSYQLPSHMSGDIRDEGKSAARGAFQSSLLRVPKELRYAHLLVIEREYADPLITPFTPPRRRHHENPRRTACMWAELEHQTRRDINKYLDLELALPLGCRWYLLNADYANQPPYWQRALSCILCRATFVESDTLGTYLFLFAADLGFNRMDDQQGTVPSGQFAARVDEEPTKDGGVQPGKVDDVVGAGSKGEDSQKSRAAEEFKKSHGKKKKKAADAPVVASTGDESHNLPQTNGPAGSFWQPQDQFPQQGHDQQVPDHNHPYDPFNLQNMQGPNPDPTGQKDLPSAASFLEVPNAFQPYPDVYPQPDSNILTSPNSFHEHGIYMPASLSNRRRDTNHGYYSRNRDSDGDNRFSYGDAMKRVEDKLDAKIERNMDRVVERLDNLAIMATRTSSIRDRDQAPIRSGRPLSDNLSPARDQQPTENPSTGGDGPHAMPGTQQSQGYGPTITEVEEADGGGEFAAEVSVDPIPGKPLPKSERGDDHPVKQILVDAVASK